MRTLFLATALPLFALAAGEPLTGTWEIWRSAAGRESTATCTFAQKEAELTGNCTTGEAQVPLTGKIEGKKVTWTIKTDSEGGPVTVLHEGTLESDGAMSGKITAVEFGVEGEFKAKRK
jgi:hypothetical protein